MKRFFVTGTDTEVGKTVTSAIFTLALPACYWKPVQSGDPDDKRVQQLTELPANHFFPAAYSLKASLSPDQAARRENIQIDLEKIILPTTSGPLIVEGAGGIFTPLNDTTCMLDLMRKLNLPIIIVSRGGLGTINHTLMTIEVLRQRHFTIQGIVFSGQLNPENQYTIEKWGNVRTLLHVPFLEKLAIKPWVEQNRKIILAGLT